MIRVTSGRDRKQASHGTKLLLRLPWVVALAFLVTLGSFEAYRAYAFYADLDATLSALTALRDELDLAALQGSEDEVLATQVALREAIPRAESARRFVQDDPLLGLARRLPLVGPQANGLSGLVEAAEESARTGLLASEVALAFVRHENDPVRSSIQEALAFLVDQKAPMLRVEEGLERLKLLHAGLPDGLIGPLGAAQEQLGEAVEKLEGLVTGYLRAETFLPSMLGVGETRTYLVLPQNDTELFPSGGLISSYGIATFRDGELDEMSFEYFEALFARWQELSGGEYVAPPEPLRQYLKQDYSWGLGEAGWYPDFPTTSGLASDFVQRGGGPATDGTIAIDTHFIRELLAALGEVYVPAYDVTVSAENMQELTLELTRDEWDVAVEDQKAFLSYLSKALLQRVFAAPREEWIDLLALFDRMAKEKHLQIHFADAGMQALAVAYGLDGGIREPGEGNFLLVADTSVNSTKLNMILETAIDLRVRLDERGDATSTVRYSVTNSFPAWAEGRDPYLVSRLMFDGVYGSYLRVYAPLQSRLLDVRFGGQPVGAERIEEELSYRTFGRYFPVLPGTSAALEVTYESPAVVVTADRLQTYRLYVQKQAGTSHVPLKVNIELPPEAHLDVLTLDGEPRKSLAFETTLATDRVVEVTYRLR